MISRAEACRAAGLAVGKEWSSPVTIEEEEEALAAFKGGLREAKNHGYPATSVKKEEVAPTKRWSKPLFTVKTVQNPSDRASRPVVDRTPSNAVPSVKPVEEPIAEPPFAVRRGQAAPEETSYAAPTGAASSGGGAPPGGTTGRVLDVGRGRAPGAEQ